MGMTKAEKLEMEELKKQIKDLKVLLSLKNTEQIDFDLDYPTSESGLVCGWSYNITSGAFKSCSTSVHHGNGWEKTHQKNPIKQYSTRLLALRAWRNMVEINSAQKLYEIDCLIDEEIKKGTEVNDGND